jgi:cytochrome c5
MTFEHSPDAVEKEMESHPVTLAIWIVVGTVSLIVGIILIAQFAIGAYGGRSLANDPAMAPEALAKRIGPVAKLQVEGAPEVAPAAQGQAPRVAAAKVAAAAPAGAAPAAPAAAAAGGKPDGKKVYDTACMACHMTGAANAPKLGDKAAWAPRIKTGTEALYASVIKGKGAMPPKGGNAALSDADVKAAVDYLVAGSK